MLGVDDIAIFAGVSFVTSYLTNSFETGHELQAKSISHLQQEVKGMDFVLPSRMTVLRSLFTYYKN